MKQKKRMNKKGRLALVQILTLIIGIFAFAWLVGMNTPSVDGLSNGEKTFAKATGAVGILGGVIGMGALAWNSWSSPSTTVTPSSAGPSLLETPVSVSGGGYESFGRVACAAPIVGQVIAPLTGDVIGITGMIAGSATCEAFSGTAWKDFFFGTDGKYGLGGSEVGGLTSPGMFGTQAILQSALWAGIAYGAVTMLGGLLGLDDAKTKAIASAAAGK